MGLASALTTALTGMSAAETQIGVDGNNLANSQTVGFKASQTLFATQFLQTLSLGSAPSGTNGGTNPSQTGLGVEVATITPDFSQGTIQISSKPSDLAIQGNGFFMVKGNSGEQLYTRNGSFTTNGSNQLVNSSGNQLLGYGVDSSFNIQRTQLVPLTIPLGSAAVAKATTNVSLQGVLSPSGDVADTGQVIQSAVLGDASIPQPTVTSTTINASTAPSIATAGTVANYSNGTGTQAPGSTYTYELTYVDGNGNESPASSPIVATVPGGTNTITLNNLPTDPLGNYLSINVYRTTPGGTTPEFLGTAVPGGSFKDDNSIALSSTPLNTNSITGNYSYVVTYSAPGFPDSRPSPALGPANVINGRIVLGNLPSPPPGGNPPYTQVNVYRNLSTDSSSYFLVGTAAPGSTFTDTASDATISANQALNLNGPPAQPNTLLSNVLTRTGTTYTKAFDLGTSTSGSISFTANKGGKDEQVQTLTITPTTTLQDLATFIAQSSGIQTTSNDAQNPIPNSMDTSGKSSALAPGASIQNGVITVVSNNGVDNAVSVPLSSLVFTPTGGSATTPNLAFGTTQAAKGQSAETDFLVYDSLGNPLNVRVTSVLQSVSDTSTTYRWFADSAQNVGASGNNNIAVGTGLVTFDGNGNFISSTNSTVAINRANVPAQSPLEFNLDFSKVSGLAATTDSLSATDQDGSPPGTLTSFNITNNGIINGVFSNGISRSLGQLQLATFANNDGLQQRGQNLYAQGSNSGLPIQNDPGQNGSGTIIAGALEQSNTDIGKSLTDLVLASTQYRGNSQIITTTQTLFNDLLNLQR